MVLRDYLPAGIRGIVIAGLLAAFMSTFSSTVNSGAAFVVRDIWQPLLKRTPSERQAVRFSYLATFLIVLGGLAIGFQGESISTIWTWIMMALGAGVIVPNVLRWYWWRMNGWGYATGTMGGILLALVVLFFPEAPMYIVFPLLATVSLFACLAGSLATAPVDREVLAEFYCSVRPFGFWGPVRRNLHAEKRLAKSERAGLTVLNVGLGMVAISGGYLFPMYLVGHWYVHAFLWLGAAVAAAWALKYTWYRRL
jgi:hypothetical protein